MIRWLCFSAIVLVSTQASAELCSAWGESVKVGTLDKDQVNESSGLEYSKTGGGRLYHINDSGDKGRFYVSSSKGENLKAVEVEGFKAKDVEAIGLGPCPSQGSCLYLADIGDNNRKRKSIQVAIVNELQQWPKAVKANKLLTLVYPDGARDAEALAVHPNGDLYIISKESDFNRFEAKPARVYRLSKEKLRSSKATQTLMFVGELNLPQILNMYTFLGSLVTDLDISSDGQAMALLTYQTILLVRLDLSKTLKPVSEWKEGEDYRIIATKDLPQQEALAFADKDQGLFYTTEYHKRFDEVPILQVPCKSSQ